MKATREDLIALLWNIEMIFEDNGDDGCGEQHMTKEEAHAEVKRILDEEEN